MFFTAEDNAIVDEIFSLDLTLSQPKNGEDAILLSAITQPALIRRAFYLSASADFRESYLADLKSHQSKHDDIMPKVHAFLTSPREHRPDIDALIAEQFQDAEKMKERYPLLLKTIPPLTEADSQPPARSMEFRLRLAMHGFSQKTLDALKCSYAALKAEGTTPLARQADIVAQLEGFRCAAVAEATRQEALFDLAFGDEESLCGGEL